MNHRDDYIDKILNDLSARIEYLEEKLDQCKVLMESLKNKNSQSLKLLATFQKELKRQGITINIYKEDLI